MAARAGVEIRNVSAAPCFLWEGTAGEVQQDAQFGISAFGGRGLLTVVPLWKTTEQGIR